MCIPCQGAPAGSTFCPATSCSPGQYLSNAQCLSCPSGSACSGGTAQPTACISPQIPNTGSSACVNPATSCDPGQYLSSSLCLPCSNSNVCAGGTSQPASCTSPLVPNWNRTVCQQVDTTCNPGSFLYQMQVCRPCYAGSVCAGGTAAPTYCQMPSQQPNAAMTACVSVPNCPAGQYMNPSTLQCIACTTGAMDVCYGGYGATVGTCSNGRTPNPGRTACLLPGQCSGAPPSCSQGYMSQCQNGQYVCVVIPRCTGYRSSAVCSSGGGVSQCLVDGPYTCKVDFPTCATGDFVFSYNSNTPPSQVSLSRREAD
jgi:hypothetical protein